MSRQGYLVLHEKRQAPKIWFFSLEDGFLRYYLSAQCTTCVGEVRLSGCKIVVKAQKRQDNMPNSFFLETRKVFVKDRSYTLGTPVRLELSAHSNDERQEWGKALFSWQRYYWRDPQSPEEVEARVEANAVKAQLELIVRKFHPKESSNNQSSNNSSSGALAAAKQPLTFLKRNASSLRKSFSMYMPSTTSSASTVASSVSSTSKSQVEAGSEVTDCAKDKVVLAKVAYPTEHIYRSNNQQETQVC
ncbi:hypothetical protein Poli38472_012481 [Pythium oligandrum]|uniref:PH domain-containing protein n=1 Tax=Pythium oligandrum TaxID=41045 RepID=A0A8K1FKQ1_PYTOL|nr:hypothetical protein Poli38472_012481 [Pythium oligandrum]|eukprot:TMW67365.1 hypothetical protein Poli38472_012481 [Pythium oligandrum]